MTEVFDYSNMRGDYKSPLDPHRLKAKPWKDVTHGRYKDIFNLSAVNKHHELGGARPTRLSPDQDYRVDNVNRADD